MKKKVLTVIYNMCSGNFSTTKKEILTCFECNEHKAVHEAIEELKDDDIVYTIPMRNCLGHFQGVQHYINWDKFTDDMIDQNLGLEADNELR